MKKNGLGSASDMKPIYFDNAATSWPKPAGVSDAISGAMSTPLGNPGRSGHRMAIASARLVLEAREAVARLFMIDDPTGITFTKNATEALNLAIYGLVKPGDHVITTAMEHNSVMRPLRHLEALGADLTVLPCSQEGSLEPAQVRQAIGPKTRLVVTTHGSNVTGAILPVEEIARICRQAEVPYLVDAAQTAGVCSLDLSRMGIDLLAFTGHKGLLGPTGTGGLYIRPGLELSPLIRGGTGSLSDQETQPEFPPDRYESGTVNVIGLAGLAAGVDYLLEKGTTLVREHDKVLLRSFLDAARGNSGCHVYGPSDPERQVGVVSFNIEGVSPSEVGRLLDSEFDIMCRIGLHCAPIAHRTMGTFPDGTVRFSWGSFNTIEEIARAMDALERIAHRARAGSGRN